MPIVSALPRPQCLTARTSSPSLWKRSSWIVVVVGGLFWLAGRDAQQPTHQIEKNVPLANLQNAATPQ